jgi:hypothetical protein
MPQEPKDPPYRWIGLLVALVVMIATYLYHVEWWTEFAQ